VEAPEQEAEEAAPVSRAEGPRRLRRPWWEEAFSEDFIRAERRLSPEEISREVDFIEHSLGIQAGGVVLDVACGAGYHAVELARRGYGVVGYDLSLYQLALAGDHAQEQGQKINFLQGDVREMAFEEMFDGLLCWNTSFGYFEEEKNTQVAARMFQALRPGGTLLLDVTNRDFVSAHQPGQVSFEGDGCVCMDDVSIDYITSRMRVKRSLILDDGRTRECTYSVRIYSLHELGKLLHDVGFRVCEVSGHPSTQGAFFGTTSPRIIVLAQRP
jgi:2-polyprenyl-3-methyl-5-hydroxy-6-metoxy-1,4-benzoquinol methylase